MDGMPRSPFTGKGTQMETERQYILYMHIAPNGKRYVGITGQKEAKSRWDSGYGYRRQAHFFNAIKKYGWENFEHVILASGLSAEEAEIAERKCIKHWDTRNSEKGYNSASGGTRGSIGYRHTEEARSRIGEASRKRTLSEEARRKLSELKSGKKQPMWLREKWSAQRKNTPLTDSQKAGLEKGRKPRKPVYCLTNGKLYASMGDAVDELGIDQANLARCLNGTYKATKGYQFRWPTEEERKCLAQT